MFTYTQLPKKKKKNEKDTQAYNTKSTRYFYHIKFIFKNTKQKISIYAQKAIKIEYVKYKIFTPIDIFTQSYLVRLSFIA